MDGISEHKQLLDRGKVSNKCQHSLSGRVFLASLYTQPLPIFRFVLCDSTKPNCPVWLFLMNMNNSATTYLPVCKCVRYRYLVCSFPLASNIAYGIVSLPEMIDSLLFAEIKGRETLHTGILQTE